jgi:hypothetical protein
MPPSVTYEGVTEFIYLDTLISNDNSIQKEIQRRILAGNRTCFAAISLFRNRLLYKATKIRLCRKLKKVSNIWSRNIGDDEERRASFAYF